MTKNLQAAPRNARRPETLTIVVPAFNEANAIGPVLEEIDRALQALSPPVVGKIIVVDDGSRDDTAVNASRAVCRSALKVLRLSRNFGKEAAMAAGLRHIEDAHSAAVIMDADGQHPPALLQSFVDLWRQGHDIVYARRVSRDTDSFLRRKLSDLYYRLVMKGTRFIERDAGDFRLLSPRVIAALNELPEKNLFMKGLFNWVGFSKTAVDYAPRERMADASKFTSIFKLLRYGFQGLISFSALPLRLISVVGMVVALASLVYGFYILLRTLFFGADVAGWATLAVGTAFLGGIQLMSIGMLGEYIAQIFVEVKNRPAFIVMETLHGLSPDSLRQAA